MAMTMKQGTPNPYGRANCLSKLTYWWLLDIFRLGKNNNLREENLYNVLPENASQALGDQLENSWEDELIKAKKKSRPPRLWNAIRKTFGWTIFKQAIFMFIPHLCKIIQPLILAKLILYFNPTSTITLKEAYIYGSGLLLMSILQMLMQRHSLLDQYMSGMNVRIACSSLLYRKALKLSCLTTKSGLNGLIINIMSNDLAKLEKFIVFMHYLWLTPLLMILMSYLVWHQLGLAGFCGILFMLIQIVPIQVIWYKVASKLRAESAARTDERLLLIGEIINGIRVIKMYAWEHYFERLVQLARRHEIDTLLKLSYVKGTNYAMGFFTDRIALFGAVAVYVYLGNAITADRIFSTVHYFVLMRQYAGKQFPQAVFLGSATNVAVERMEDFLSQAEKEAQHSATTITEEDNSAIAIYNVDASWDGTSNANHISNVSLCMEPEQLYVVVGPVGSGKSTLLKVIAGELQPKTGHVSVRGKISFSSQEPWLFTGSVRDNILFGEEYDEDRYKQVIDACQLSIDLQQLPFGDNTLVGERGMSLSGGQCARVNLARAVYRDAEIYLLDDPLSAVDSHVSRMLLDECVCGFLKMKTRILVTHQVQYLERADGIIVLNDGLVEFEGPYESYIKNDKYVQRLQKEQMQQETGLKGQGVWQTPVLSETDTKSKEKRPEETKELITRQSNTALLLKYFKAGGSYLTFCLLMLLFLITQLAISGFEYWFSYWTNQEDKRLESIRNANLTNPTNKRAPIVEYLSQQTALSVSGGLVLAIVLFSNLKNLWFFKRSLSSSETIHNAMFSRLLRTPVQFFNCNPSGRMLNRLSKDTATADDDMPNAMIEVLERALAIVSVFIQIIIVNWWTAGPLLILSYLFVKVNQLYLPTAQGLKRLEGNAKSPVLSLVSSTLLGLPTIRSCRAEATVTRSFDARQDSHTAANYLCSVTMIAYGMWLDLLAITLLAFMVYSFIPIKADNTRGGDVGLALTQFLSICTVLQYAMRQFSELMAQMTALERMLGYAQLEQEGPLETVFDETLAEVWPSRAEIQFRDLSFKYSQEEQPALRDLNFSIKPNMKVRFGKATFHVYERVSLLSERSTDQICTYLRQIGVVGRTGAGKSSLIAALFRLTDFDGSVLIDDVDTKRIGLLKLRSKISIIPQEPTLFTGSLRDNLDPLGQYDDASLWSALQDVEMHRAFESLDQAVHGNLSAGQSQLLCLARAIVRKNKILVLDEATANVDLVTDQLIQKTIRSKFKDCTVISIAHRLNTIIDSDAILVMDAGRAVEFDRPRNLLRKANGYLSRMLDESDNAAELKEIANNVGVESHQHFK